MRVRSKLAWRVLIVNSAVVVAATLVLAIGPATISTPVRIGELGVLAAGLALVLAANVVLVRRVFAPLDRLGATMREVDPLRPGTRVTLDGSAGDVRELARAFNEMLARLEDERRESARRAVAAQEDERRRLARELHDELGQTMTAVLLGIDATIRDPSHPRLEEARETARASLDDVRRIARDLRPGPLDELGLVSALHALSTRFTRTAHIAVDRELEPVGPLGDEVEVVLYRVAQEALTNVARHAGARHVRITLARAADGSGVVLTVDDDGAGVRAGTALAEGRGVTGMRERALLVRGRLHLGPSPLGGARVRLEVPAR
jgi:two-component system sensor histidine kinase UhpB